MPFTTVNLKSGESVRVEHSEDATREEIVQLAREDAAAQGGRHHGGEPGGSHDARLCRRDPAHPEDPRRAVGLYCLH